MPQNSEVYEHKKEASLQCAVNEDHSVDFWLVDLNSEQQPQKLWLINECKLTRRPKFRIDLHKHVIITHWAILELGQSPTGIFDSVYYPLRVGYKPLVIKPFYNDGRPARGRHAFALEMRKRSQQLTGIGDEANAIRTLTRDILLIDQLFPPFRGDLRHLPSDTPDAPPLSSRCL